MNKLARPKAAEVKATGFWMSPTLSAHTFFFYFIVLCRCALVSLSQLEKKIRTEVTCFHSPTKIILQLDGPHSSQGCLNDDSQLLICVGFLLHSRAHSVLTGEL